MSRLWITLVLSAASIMGAQPGAAQQDGPAEVVERFQDVLIAVMKHADEWGYEGRYERLAPAVEQSHDLPGIARITLGRYWKNLTDKQKALFLETFTELSIATYASRFDSYSGQTFELLSTEQLSDDEAVVHTRLLESAGDTIQFDLLLRRAGGHWRIVNIIVDGVSDLALKRAEYTSIIRREGFEALIDSLEEKIAQYSEAISNNEETNKSPRP